MTTSSIAISTTTTPDASIEVWSVPLSCCYIEGALGLMQVRSEDGSEVTSVLALHGKRDHDLPGPWAGWDPIAVPPGRYSVEVWNYVCPGMCGDKDAIAALDWDSLGPRSDLCTTTVEALPGEAVELTAQWKSPEGCVSFDRTDWSDTTLPDMFDSLESGKA